MVCILKMHQTRSLHSILKNIFTRQLEKVKTTKECRWPPWQQSSRTPQPVRYTVYIIHRRVWPTWELEWTGGPRAGGGVWISTAAGWWRGIRRVWRDGERTASTPSSAATITGRLLEGLWKGGVQGHVRLVVGEVAELYQQAMLRVELAVPRYQDRREHWVVGRGRNWELAQNTQTTVFNLIWCMRGSSCFFLHTLH